MVIDTHCHINDPEAFQDPETALEEARQAGVDRVLVVGIDPQSCLRALDLADRYSNVWAIIGRHPNHASGFAGPEEIDALLDHPKVVALGEIGLDYHWDYSTREEQQAALLTQLDLAARRDKPVVFHCREAYPDLLDVLEGRPPRPYLFHCFSGSADDARRAVALGAYFGVDGPITYKKATELREIVRGLPRERIVVETDSPYLSPEPHRGKPNKPANAAIVCEALASVLGMSPVACAALTTENAERFFRLPPA